VPIGSTAEIGIHVQDLLDLSQVTLVTQDPSVPFVLDDAVGNGTVGSHDVVVVMPDFGAAFAFQNLSFEQIVSGVRIGIEFLQDLLADQPFYTQPLPIINRSLAEVFTFVDQLAIRLDDAVSDPEGTIASVEASIEKALGITDDNALPSHEQKFSLKITDGILDIHIGLAALFDSAYRFALDLGSFKQMSGQSGAPGLSGIDGLTDSTGLAAGGSILLEAFAEASLDIGIDAGAVSGGGAPVVFLYDFDPVTGLGTHIALGGRLVGRDLALGFHVGPITLGVNEGFVVLDQDGDLATDDYAMLTIAIDQAGGTVADDGRYYFGTESLQSNIQVKLIGSFAVELPLRISVVGTELDLAEPISIRSNPVYGDQGLSQLLKHLANAPDKGSESPVTLTFPDINAAFADLGGKFTLFGILIDPSFILDGVDATLGAIQDVFESSLGQDIPLIGSKLANAATMIREFRQGFLADLREKLSGNGKAIEYIQDSLYNLLGPDGLNILLDSNHDGFVSFADVRIEWLDVNGEKITDFQVGDSVPENADAIQFDMKLGGILYGGGVDIPLDIDLPGFGLKVDGGFAIELSWSFDFGFGLSVTDGVYLVTNADGAVPELQLNASVFLDGEAGNPDVTTQFQGVGKLLFFKATIEDTDRSPTELGFQPSGLFGLLSLNYEGNSKNRLTATQILSTSLEETFQVDFGVQAELNLAMTLEVDAAVKGLPKLKGDLVVDWGWDIRTGSSKPVIQIQNLRVEIGSVVSDFLKPIAERIEGVLEPFRPIITALTKEIPGLAKFKVAPANLMGLINVLFKLKGLKPIDWSFVYAAEQMLSLVDRVNSMLGVNGDVLLGDIGGFGSGTLVADSAGLELLEDITDALPEEFADFSKLLEAESMGAESSGSAGGSATARSGFRFVEYLLDINNWMQIFSGGDAVLFTYEMPLLSFKAEFDLVLARIPLAPLPFTININAFGSIEATADLAFGYDTFGIRKLISSGVSNVGVGAGFAAVMDGFYVSDVTLPEFKNGKVVKGTGGKEKPEFTLKGKIGLSAGVQVWPFIAGVRGGVELKVGLDLKDIGRSVLTKDASGNVTDVTYQADGKIRISEMATLWNYQSGGFTNLFDMFGKLDLVVGAFVKLKVFKKTKTLLNVDLLRVNLLTFSHRAPDVTPSLAVIDGTTLYVNSGTRAADRLYFNTEDGSETFLLSGSGGTVNIEFDDWYVSYHGVTHVVMNGGAGNDVLDASRLDDVTVEFDGGSGNDSLISGSAGGVLRGGDGNDTLEGGSGDDTLEGGAGDDRLMGSGGNDLLDGGTGDDTISGGTNNDSFFFADNYGNNRVTEQGQIVELSFNAVTAPLTVTIRGSGVTVINPNGDEFRLRGATGGLLILGTGDDIVYIDDYPPGVLEIRDSGGSDTYYVREGRPVSALSQGVLKIVDSSGDFDEVVLQQTRSQDPLVLETHRVSNGREILEYDSGIERLTIVGNAGQFGSSGIVDFGGDVTVTSVGDGPLNLQTTGLRIVAQKFEYDRQIQAGHIVLDTFKALDLVHRLNAAYDGYLDLRSYEQGANLYLKVDLLVSSGDSWDGAGTGWIRLIAPDGSIYNENDVELLAAAGHLILKARNSIGERAAPILARAEVVSAVSSALGSGDIVITGHSDLAFALQGDHSEAGVAGILVPDETLLPVWRGQVSWDDAGAGDWLGELADGNDVHAVAAGAGDVLIRLSESDARLTLLSGDIVAQAPGRDITLTADDLDFRSGAGQVIGSGNLVIQSGALVWNYYLGTAAESASGDDLPREFFESAMELTTRDLAALADGFELVQIGRSDVGNLMVLGDATTESQIRLTGEGRGMDSSFRDRTFLLSDDVIVRGEVQAPANVLQMVAGSLTVETLNVHSVTEGPGSGLSADQLILEITGGIELAGSLQGTTSVNATAGAAIRIGYDPVDDPGMAPVIGSPTVILHSGAAISKAPDGAMSIVAGELELRAATGINDLDVSVGSLNASTATGDIELRESDPADSPADGLILTHVSAPNGSVTIQSVNRLEVRSVIATGAGAGADLESLEGNLVVVGSDTADVIHVDSYLALRAPAGFELPRRVSGKTVILESSGLMELNSEFVVTTRLDLVSDGSIRITGDVVSPVAEVRITALGNAPAGTVDAGVIMIESARFVTGDVELRAPTRVEANLSTDLLLAGFVGGLNDFDPTGSIALQANGTLKLSSGIFAALGEARLMAGSIQSGDGPLLIAEHTIAEARSSVALRLWTDRLSVRSTIGGDIVVSEADGLVAEEVYAENGSVFISARGDLTAVDVRVATDAVGNDVTLEAVGDLFVGKVIAGESAGAAKAHSQVTLDAFGSIREPAGAVDNNEDLVDVDAWKVNLKHGQPIPDPVLVTGPDVTGASDELEIVSVDGLSDGATALSDELNIEAQGDYVLAAPTLTGDLNLAVSGSLVILNLRTQPGQNLALTSGGDITSLSSIDVGDAALSLNSAGGISIPGVLTAGQLSIGSSGNVSLTTNVNEISLNAGPGSNVSISNQGPLTIGSSASPGADITVSAGGDLTLGGGMTASNLSLESTGGSLILGGTLDVGSEGTISIKVAGAIEGVAPVTPQTAVGTSTRVRKFTPAGALMATPPSADFVSGVLVLSAEAGIGTGTALRTTATEFTGTTLRGDIRIQNSGSLLVHEAVALDGSVEISADGSLEVESVRAVGTGHHVRLSTSNGGNISVREILARDGDITVNATGSISKLEGSAGVNFAGHRLTLSADVGFVAGGAISSEVSELTAEAAAGDLILANKGDLLVRHAITQDGSIDLSVEGSLTVELARAHGAGDVRLSTSGGGDVTVGLVTATGNALTIVSGGVIEELSDDAGPELVGAQVVLTASEGIGTAGALEIAALSLEATAPAGAAHMVNQLDQGT
jgi:hypothetical protein